MSQRRREWGGEQSESYKGEKDERRGKRRKAFPPFMTPSPSSPLIPFASPFRLLSSRSSRSQNEAKLAEFAQKLRNFRPAATVLEAEIASVKSTFTNPLLDANHHRSKSNDVSAIFVSCGTLHCPELCKMWGWSSRCQVSSISP